LRIERLFTAGCWLLALGTPHAARRTVVFVFIALRTRRGALGAVVFVLVFGVGVEGVAGEEAVEFEAQAGFEADGGFGGAEDVPPLAGGEAGVVAEQLIEGMEGEVELIGDFEGRIVEGIEDAGDEELFEVEDAAGEGAGELALDVGGDAAAAVFAFAGGDFAGAGPFGDDGPEGDVGLGVGDAEGGGEARGVETEHGDLLKTERLKASLDFSPQRTRRNAERILGKGIAYVSTVSFLCALCVLRGDQKGT